jgi:hypothetical protein
MEETMAKDFYRRYHESPQPGCAARSMQRFTPGKTVDLEGWEAQGLGRA